MHCNAWERTHLPGCSIAPQHSQEHNRDQDCFFKMETGILRQATSWTTPYFLVIGGVFLWTFINYLNWDEIDISQRRKHWTLLLQDTGREISDQSTFCTLLKTSEWIKNKGGQNISKPELGAFQRKQVRQKKNGSRVTVLRSQFHRRNHLCSLQSKRYQLSQKQTLHQFCNHCLQISNCLVS